MVKYLIKKSGVKKFIFSNKKGKKFNKNDLNDELSGQAFLNVSLVEFVVGWVVLEDLHEFS